MMALHQGPWAAVGIGGLQRVIKLFIKLIVVFIFTPVLPGHAPAGGWIFLQLFKALFLLLLADMDKKLNDDCPVLCQNLLKIIGLVQKQLQFTLVQLWPVNKIAVIAAVKQDHPSLFWCFGPVAPQQGPVDFVIVGLDGIVYHKASGVQRDHQVVDQRPLARSVPAFKNNQYGYSQLLYPALQGAQLNGEGIFFFLVNRFFNFNIKI